MLIKSLFLLFLIVANVPCLSLYAVVNDEEWSTLESSIEVLSHLNDVDALPIYTALIPEITRWVEECQKECIKIDNNVGIINEMLAQFPGAFNEVIERYFLAAKQWKAYNEVLLKIVHTFSAPLVSKEFLKLIDAFKNIKAYKPEFTRRYVAIARYIDSLNRFFKEVSAR